MQLVRIRPPPARALPDGTAAAPPLGRFLVPQAAGRRRAGLAGLGWDEATTGGGE